VDGVILVVRAGSTHRRAAREAKEVLAKAGPNFIGAVLNDYQDFVPEFVRRWL
jgi:Mrp family chromosome partitioning ATPase